MRTLKIICLALLTVLIPKIGCFAQLSGNNNLLSIQNSFDKYTSETFPEKLFVHTDKNSYTAGELMWFKIYDVNGINQQPTDLSKVVYIEVLDNNHTPLIQAKIAMKEGTGSGSVYIPVTMLTGHYLFRAYTSWMKNFSPDDYFTKQLTIINPLKSPGKQARASIPEYDIQFFPEGGNLVNGLTSVVGVKATDKWGKSMNFKGAVIDKQNDTVAKFEPFKFGIGHFTFKPDKNNVYRAVINIGGKVIQKSIPEINSTGYVINLKDNGTGELSVTVATNIQTGKVYLFGYNHNITMLAREAAIENGTAHFTFNKSVLGYGVSHLTIFNNERQPVCERLYFKRPAKNLLINAAADQEQYTQRKKVTVNIAAKNGNGAPVVAGLSMSVYRVDSLQNPGQEDIQSYFWLTSELRGIVESAGYYFEHDGAEAEEAADNLMLTQGWSKFNWSDVLNGTPPAFNFLPEYNGPMITGNITEQATDKPAADKIVYLSIPGKRLQMYTGVSDSAGRLKFSLKSFYGPAEIVAQTNPEIDTGYKIEIQQPFSEQYAKSILPPLTITPAMQALFKEHSIYMQVQNVYNTAKIRQFYDPDVDSSAFYGPPSKTYMLDNFTRFATLEEVLREYVSEVNIRNTNNKYHIIIINGNTFFNDSDPLVMLDGVPYFNINKVFATDPIKIRKLELVNNVYYYGWSIENGILSFSTYKGDMGGTEIDPHAVVMDYEGLELQRQFYSPAYDTEEAYDRKIPDFRNVLYWAPNITTLTQGKNSVSFYTSDQPGKYIGVVEGLTFGGEAGSRYFTFDVVN